MTNVIELRPVRPPNRTTQAVMVDMVAAVNSLREMMDHWFRHGDAQIASIDTTAAGIARLCVEYRAAEMPPRGAA